MSKANRLPTVVSLFSGTGGLDAGLERAGLSVIACVENDPDCVATLRLNQDKRMRIRGTQRTYLAGTRIVHANIEEVLASEIRLSAHDAPPDVIAGGPPCQPFSAAGKMRSLADPRGSLFREFVRLAGELMPRMILFENVRGLVTARGPDGRPGEALCIIKESFEALGYATRFGLLNAADYGVPQRRIRLFMVASRCDRLPEFPEPTHAETPVPSLLGTRAPWRTLGDSLAGRPPPSEEDTVRPTPRLARSLDGVPCGSGLRSAGAREATRPGGHWGYRQGTFIADPDSPARTVTAASTQDWIRLADGTLRRLTARECAALQGFPEEWGFVGGRASVFRQIGNAVQGTLAELLGRCLCESLAAGRSAKPVSAPLPEDFLDAIDYTMREERRNGRAREAVRSLHARDPAAARLLKGVGRATT